jgi:glutamine amidotransferase
MAYSGGSIRLNDLLFEPKDNLIDQSLTSRSAETPTNGDGFGVGWYGSWKFPGLFRSIRPAWNDFNLRDLALNIESKIFMAHVRATSLATVQETNCHPFRYNNWLFVHNGEIFEVEKFRRELLMAVDSKYFENILGSTDSELMFHLALTFGLEQNPIEAMAKMVGFVEQTGKTKNVPESMWMTIGLSDGKTLWGFRYASDGNAPTLFHSRDKKELVQINPALQNRFSDGDRILVSEPIGKFKEMWAEVPQGSSLIIHEGNIDIKPFKPVSL